MVGPVCETGDYLALDRKLPEPKAGDLLAIMTAGAYGAVQSGTYNTRALVPEVLVKDDQYAVVRPRIEVEELIAMDRAGAVAVIGMLGPAKVAVILMCERAARSLEGWTPRPSTAMLRKAHLTVTATLASRLLAAHHHAGALLDRLDRGGEIRTPRPSRRSRLPRAVPTASATSIDSPSDFISSRQSRTSLTISPVAKPKSKVRGSTERGNLSRLAVLSPEPALMTSIMTAGSSPALTPITTASDVATIAVADRKLLASFMVCAEPGFSPMKNTLPMTSSAGFAHLEIGARPGDHHRQRALLGAADAAAHGAVDLHDVRFASRP